MEDVRGEPPLEFCNERFTHVSGDAVVNTATADR